MAAQFAAEMVGTAIGAAVGAMVINQFSKNETTPVAEAEEIISPIVDASIISLNCNKHMYIKYDKIR